MKIKDVLEAIATGLDLGPDEVTLESSSETIEDWDSLGHLTVLSALDEASGGRTADLIDLTQVASVEEVLQILREGGVLEE